MVNQKSIIGRELKKKRNSKSIRNNGSQKNDGFRKNVNYWEEKQYSCLVVAVSDSYV